jgi:hypothetical protein
MKKSGFWKDSVAYLRIWKVLEAFVEIQKARRASVEKDRVVDEILVKIKGLDAKWWLKIGSDSKLRTELEFMWSSGVCL